MKYRSDADAYDHPTITGDIRVLSYKKGKSINPIGFLSPALLERSHKEYVDEQRKAKANYRRSRRSSTDPVRHVTVSCSSVKNRSETDL